MTTYPDVATAGATPAPEVTSARVEWATVPRVDLLPPEIQEGRRLAALKRVLAGAVAATVVVCVGGVAWAQAGVGSAQEELDAAQARGTALQAQQAPYAQVPKVLGLIDAAAAAREQAMSKDVLWYGLLSDLSLTTPKGVKLDSLTVTLDTAGATAPAGDPLVPAGMGQVDFTGKATHFPDVADWLESVAGLHGLDGSSLQSATTAAGQGNVVDFSSTIKVTPGALTHRYDRKAH
jgi:hypothetical protein